VIETPRQYELARTRVAVLRLCLENLNAIARMPGIHPGIHQGLIDSRTCELQQLEFDIHCYEKQADAERHAELTRSDELVGH
jgi:hypothetical protein